MNDRRLPGLDFLRVLAMLLGIPFHAALAYTSTVTDNIWIVQSQTTHIALDIFCHFIQTFRMQLFFLLSGFLSFKFLVKSDFSTYLFRKAKTLLFPFFLGCIFLLPVLRILWLLGEAKMMNVDYNFQNLIEIAQTSRVGISFAHLWFLLYLFLCSVCAFVCKKILLNIPVFAFPVISLGAHFLMNTGRLETPFIWYPRLLLLLYYFSFFAAGLTLAKIAVLELRMPAYIHVTFVSLLLVKLFLHVNEGELLLKSVRSFVFLSTVVSWYLVTVFFMWGLRSTLKTDLIVNIRKWTYFCYLAHIIPVAFFQLIFIDFPLAPFFAFTLVTLLTFLVLFLLSKLTFVRKTIQPLLAN